MPASTHTKSTDETIKETFESIVIAFILAFIFRAYVIEAFVIPTGSMAPTLLGKHTQSSCQQCGYEWAFDQSGKDFTREYETQAYCPMCWFANPVPMKQRTLSGDRLLVQKYVYQLSEPRRWDVVVFRNPQEVNADGSPGPEFNYIKRLVGLPGEAIHLLDGNLYVRPNEFAQQTSEDIGWRIARKTDPNENRHWQDIQRAVWQPIYHSDYVPLDGGVGERSTRDVEWDVPWASADPGSAELWDVGDSDRGWRRSYRYNAQSNIASSSLEFDWAGYYFDGADYPYNEPATYRIELRQPIEDVRVAAAVVPDGSGAVVELNTTARLFETTEKLTARFENGGRVSLIRSPFDASRSPQINGTLNNTRAPSGPDDGPDTEVLDEVDVSGVLKPGRPTSIELWFVDQEALVWVDGKVVIRRPFDLTVRQLETRDAPQPKPQVSINVAGASMTLHHVEVDRDLYYSGKANSRGIDARGALNRLGPHIQNRAPIQTHADEFFVLGDNSPISDDARYWTTIEPWVRKNYFSPPRRVAGDSDPAGVVPRGLLVGRAFFIYYPAPFGIGPNDKQVLPNFGDMRLVR